MRKFIVVQQGDTEKKEIMSLREALLKCYDLKNLKPEIVQVWIMCTFSYRQTTSSFFFFFSFAFCFLSYGVEMLRNLNKNAAECDRLDALLEKGTGKENEKLANYLKVSGDKISRNCLISAV
jgi:hypothetical protein